MRQSRSPIFAAVLLLGACTAGDPTATAPVSNAAGLPIDVPPHPTGRIQPEAETKIGRVTAVDHERGTVTIKIDLDTADERIGARGPERQFRATPAALAGIRPGERVEYRYTPGPAQPRLLWIEAHRHGTRTGVPRG